MYRGGGGVGTSRYAQTIDQTCSLLRNTFGFVYYHTKKKLIKSCLGLMRVQSYDHRQIE